MAKEFETFARDSARLLCGDEVVMTLRDLSPGRKKYRGLNVRAVVSRPPRPGEATSRRLPSPGTSRHEPIWIWRPCGARAPAGAS